MNNLIIFHLILFLLTIVNCKKNFTTKKPNLQKSKLGCILGILIIIVIILILILLYIFYVHKRINNKNEKVKRQMKEYDMPIESSYNINELDTIQTVGTPSEFTDHHSESDVKTII
jgi:flagellar basal body-associated protein FliL